MKEDRSMWKLVWICLSLALFFQWANPVCAAITPEDPYDTEALSDPSPAVFTWNGSIGYYDNQLIYCGDDKKIYAYKLDTGVSALVSDTSGLGGAWGSAAGLLVSSDAYLYFHDNGDSTKIYRVLLTNAWPAAYESFDTVCSGSIYSFAENPWTNVIWFASAEFLGNMYLYEVNGTFTAATQRAAFAPPNGGGSGPIIFKETQTLLYGESVWGGDGYFHELDTATGNIATQDYLTFEGGLAGACYGYKGFVYTTSGGGNTIYYIDGNTKTAVGETFEDAQGIVFGGERLYVSEQNSGIGTISLHSLWAEIAAQGPYYAERLDDPNPAVFAWNGAIGYYDNQLIYCGDDKKIYAYDLDTGASTLVSDTSGIGDPWESAAGFLVSKDDFLYFHDNDFPTVNIYRVDLTAPWPTNYTSFNTGCSGSMYSLTQNPWTDAIWFASADFVGNMYLYEVNGTFTAATQRAVFAAPNGGGSGPIIFKETQTVLYGESVWGGDGYFHEVDTATGNIATQDYLTFEGGLAGACYGYDNIYATAGSGNTIYYIDGNTKTAVGETLEDAQGIVFGGGELYISEQKSSDGSGTINLHSLRRRTGEEFPLDDSSNCFIGASNTRSDLLEKNVLYVIFTSFLFASLFPAVRFFRRKR